jgi:hypothetical protein
MCVVRTRDWLDTTVSFLLDICQFKMRAPKQLDLALRTWGGRRDGAGRKPTPGRRRLSHRRRASHDPTCPVHVTMRAAPGLPTFRKATPYTALRNAIAESSTTSFRVLHFSAQADHLHLLVEAD